MTILAKLYFTEGKKDKGKNFDKCEVHAVHIMMKITSLPQFEF